MSSNLTKRLLGAFASSAVLVVLASPLLAQPRIRIDNVSVTEGAAGTSQQAVLNLSLTAASDALVTVSLGSSPGSPAATVGSACGGAADYVQPSGTVRFEPGVTSQRISVSVCGDAGVEADEVFRVDLLDPVGATLADLRGRVTILDNDEEENGPAPALPTLSIRDRRQPEGNESAGSIGGFLIALSSPSSQVITFDVTSSPTTATQGGGSCVPSVDYLSAGPITMTLRPGETGLSLRILVCGDTEIEPDETFRMRLSNPVGATLAVAEGVGTILNDDPTPPTPSPVLPTLSIGNASRFEGDTGGRSALFVLRLSPPSSTPVTVSVTTVRTTATEGGPCVPNVDYTGSPSPQIVTVSGEGGIFPVPVCSDTDIEPDETFQVRLSSPEGAILGVSEGRGTILNDDQPVSLLPTPLPKSATPSVVSIGDARIVEGNAGNVSAQFMISLSPPTSEPVTVTLESTRVTAIEGDECLPNIDYRGSQSSQSVTVSGLPILLIICPDTLDEPDETFQLKISNPVGATLGDSLGLVTILNDDSPPISLTLGDVTVREGPGAVTLAIFTGTLSSPAPVRFVLNPRVIGFTGVLPPGDGRASRGSDCTGTNDAHSRIMNVPIAAGGTSFTFPVVVCRDARNEPTEHLTVTIPSITTSVRVRVSEAQAHLAIQDAN